MNSALAPTTSNVVMEAEMWKFVLGYRVLWTRVLLKYREDYIKVFLVMKACKF